MADVGFTINVLGFGELYWQVLNALSAFVYTKGGGLQEGFNGLLRLTGLIGIVMASIGYIKQRDPMVYAKWVMAYVLVLQLVIIPQTTVEIYDISAQKSTPVANVPVVFALTASLITNVGVGLAESYDSLFSDLGDLRYTQTGSLFGSKMIQAARDFRIVDPQLKNEMNGYVRNCVIGDMTLNNKYTVEQLGNSKDIWKLINGSPSPVRMTEVDGKVVTCKEAVSPELKNNLREKLNAEIKNAYTIFGVNLFGKPNKTIEEELFKTRLKSVFDYYKLMTDSAENIMLQSMMINAVNEGIKDYQAYTGATAGIVNNQMNKSQMQHRFAWAIMGQKAAWFLPVLHSLLTVLLFSLFPLIIAMSTMPNGASIFRGYIQFFVSLQFWPVLFAVLNLAMTMYAHSKTASFGGISIVNIDKIDELHSDLSGVAGYLMLMIPFIAKGLVSNFSEAFNNLATSMTGHVQSSAMAVASEAASASFSLGQTHVNNASANTFNANKHDNNWTNMHGMRTEQLATGVTKTLTASRDTVFDVSPGMTRGAVKISDDNSVIASLNKAYDESKQAASTESQQYQKSLSNFAHTAIQLSKLQGHDMRLGDGVSSSDTGQYSKALSTMSHIAEEVAKRNGISTDEAFTRLTSGGAGLSGSISTDRTVLGGGLKIGLGIKGDAEAHLKYERSSNTGDRSHEGTDQSKNVRQAQDFNDAFSYVKNFISSHHFDDSHSKAASLSNQMGADLRDAETASHNYDASMSRAMRINNAKSYAESNASSIKTDLDQAFPGFVAKHTSERERDELFSHPGSMAANQKLAALGQEMVAERREELIASVGYAQKSGQIDNYYQRKSTEIANHEHQMVKSYQNNQEGLTTEASTLNIGMDETKANLFQNSIYQSIADLREKTIKEEGNMKDTIQVNKDLAEKQIKKGVYDSKNGVIPGHGGYKIKEKFNHLMGDKHE